MTEPSLQPVPPDPGDRPREMSLDALGESRPAQIIFAVLLLVCPVLGVDFEHVFVLPLPLFLFMALPGVVYIIGLIYLGAGALVILILYGMARLASTVLSHLFSHHWIRTLVAVVIGLLLLLGSALLPVYSRSNTEENVTGLQLLALEVRTREALR